MSRFHRAAASRRLQTSQRHFRQRCGVDGRRQRVVVRPPVSYEPRHDDDTRRLGSYTVKELRVLTHTQDTVESADRRQYVSTDEGR